MDRFVEHPVIGIDFGSRKIGAAVGFAVEGLGPAQVGIDLPELGPVFEEFDLQLWMDALKGLQAAQAIGVSLVKQFQRVRCFIRLLRGCGGIDQVVLGLERDGMVPRPRNKLPGRNRPQDCQVDQHPGFA